MKLVKQIKKGVVKQDYTTSKGEVIKAGTEQENTYLYVQLDTGSLVSIKPAFKNDFRLLVALAEKID